MPSDDNVTSTAQSELLKQILATVQSMQHKYTQFSAAFASLQKQVDALAETRKVQDSAEESSVLFRGNDSPPTPEIVNKRLADLSVTAGEWLASSPIHQPDTLKQNPRDQSPYISLSKRSSPALTSRIILTTYPNQSGIDPLILRWGHQDPLQRGPVVVSRNQNTIRRRNGMN